MLNISVQTPIVKKLANVREALSDLREFFVDTGAPLTEKYFSEVWGSRGHGQWRTPLFKTGRLYRSFTQAASADNRMIVTNRSLEFGSSVPYAEYHQDKILGVVNKDLLRQRYQKSLRDYILKKLEAT